MYILLKDSIPEGFAVLAAAHASLACYLKFQDDNDTQSWVSGTFYKVICKVNEKEVAIAFKPRNEWPKAFKFYRLYK